MGDETEARPRQSLSSVGRIIRSLSQALGVTASSYNTQNIVAYKHGKFEVQNDKLLEILEYGTSNEKIDALKLLEDELVNIKTNERIELWNHVKSKINLKKEGSIRSEAIQFLSKLTDFRDIPNINGLEFYADICKNVILSGQDKDMKLFLICFHNLLKFANFSSFEKYPDHPLREFLLEIFKEIMQNYTDEELYVLIISLIAECIKLEKTIFSSNDLQFLLDQIIFLGIKTTNTYILEACVDFFLSFLGTGISLDNNLYSILSILGCANALEELENKPKCVIVIDKILANDESSKFMFTLCDVIQKGSDDKYRHRMGNRPIVGCLRYMCYILKYLGSSSPSSKKIEFFFDNNLNYLLNTLILAARFNDEVISIEIVKFVVEILERPYTIKTYHAYFIETNTFWNLLSFFKWTNKSQDSFSYRLIMNELFNKLQNLELRPFYVKKLIEFFGDNYQILSSYNISYVLDYYHETLACVCGSPNWKKSCESLVFKYYSTSPADVLNLLKDAFIYCVNLKINEPSLKFYINLICYDCILGLDFELDEDIMEPLTDVIAALDNDFYKKVVTDFSTEIMYSVDINMDILMKSLIILVLKPGMKSEQGKKTLVLKSIMEICESTINSVNRNLFLRCLLLLIRIRAVKVDGKRMFYILEIKSEHTNQQVIVSRNRAILQSLNSEIDEKINFKLKKIFNDSTFERKISPYFENGESKKFQLNFDSNDLIGIYLKVLKITKKWENYFILLKHLRYQFLNTELFSDMEEDNCLKITKLFTEQMQLINTFSFKKPKWMEISHIRIAIIDVLYGFFPYNKMIPLDDNIALLRSIVLDFHFDDTTRVALLNYINCALFELPETMAHFVYPLLKMIQDDLVKPDTFFTNLEIFANLFELNTYYQIEGKEKDLNIIHHILNYISNYDITNYDSNYDELKCSKILANLLSLKISKIENKTIDSDNLVRFRIPTNLIYIDIITDELMDNIFNQLCNCFNSDDILKQLMPPIESSKIKDTKKLSEYNKNAIKVILANGKMRSEIHNECLGMKILVSQVLENKDYFTVSNYGIENINLKHIIINKTNVISFTKIFIMLSIVSSFSGTE